MALEVSPDDGDQAPTVRSSPGIIPTVFESEYASNCFHKSYRNFFLEVSGMTIGSVGVLRQVGTTSQWNVPVPTSEPYSLKGVQIINTQELLFQVANDHGQDAISLGKGYKMKEDGGSEYCRDNEIHLFGDLVVKNVDH
jgi:hypothetical protein